MTPSLTLLMICDYTVLYYGDAVASVSLQTRKTWYSEYAKWLPPVAFWQL